MPKFVWVSVVPVFPLAHSLNEGNLFKNEFGFQWFPSRGSFLQKEWAPVVSLTIIVECGQFLKLAFRSRWFTPKTINEGGVPILLLGPGST